MRVRLLLILGFIFYVNTIIGANHTIPASSVFADGEGMGVQPGDTVFLEAGQKPYLLLRNFQGSADNYIIIINKGGRVEVSNDDYTYGVVTFNSRYFRLTGSGDPAHKYGIYISASNGASNGLSLDKFSSDFEIDHLEIYNTGFAGIMSKTNPECDLSPNRGNFTQYNTIFHDNYIHKTGGEGFYVGHSYYNGYEKNCDGETQILYPHDIINVKIYNNIIDSTSFDGIQVGCVVEGCEIYGNTITNAGYIDDAEGLYYGMSGIVIGGGTKGKCYNNFISEGYGTGISVFGLGDVWVYNNLIVDAGQNSAMLSLAPDNHHPYGIFCDDRSTIPGSSFNFVNNTIVNPRDIGIRFWSMQSEGNLLFNNLIVDPGVKDWSESRSMIDVINPHHQIADTVSGGNVFEYGDLGEVASQYFKNIEALDFTPVPAAASIDKGVYWDTEININIDYNNRKRVLGKTIDAGAYEYLPLPSSPYIQQTIVKIKEGERLVIEAQNSEYPSDYYSYTWIHNQTDTLRNESDSILVVYPVSAEDKGVYSAIVTNGFDSVLTNEVEIIVLKGNGVKAGADTTICIGSELELFGVAAHALKVSWSTSGDGTFSEDSTLNTIYYPGEEDAESEDVEISLTAHYEEGIESITNSFVLSFQNCTGIDDAQSNVKIYPLPVKETLNITSETERIVKFRIFDLVGNLKHEQLNNESHITFNTSFLARGMYFLQVFFKDGVETVKIVKI